MKPRRKSSKRMRVLHLWTLPELQKAVPYLRSVIVSLREHWLDTLTTERHLNLAAQRPQSTQRNLLVAADDLREERRRAQQKFEDALEELNRIDVFLLDAVKGLALVPFRKEDDLAWFVFDQFSPRGIIGWRNHDDPIEKCLPLNLLEQPVAPGPVLD